VSKVANHHAIQSLFHLIHTQLICLKYNSFNRRKSEQKGKGGYMWTAKRFNSPGSMAHIKPNKSSTPQEILGEWLPKILKTVTSMSQRNTGKHRMDTQCHPYLFTALPVQTPSTVGFMHATIPCISQPLPPVSSSIKGTTLDIRKH